MKSRRIACFIALIGLFAGVSAGADDVQLRLTQGGTQIELVWTGGSPEYTVYRGTSPQEVTDRSRDSDDHDGKIYRIYYEG